MRNQVGTVWVWVGAALLASGCMVRSGYSQRGGSGGTLAVGIDAAEDHGAYGSQFGLSIHDHERGEPISFRGDVHLGISSIDDMLEMTAGALEWSALLFAGFDRTHTEVLRDTTFPVGAGLDFAMRIGDGAVTLRPRYNLHLGDDRDLQRRHEVLLTVGYGWIPDLDIEFPGMKN